MKGQQAMKTILMLGALSAAVIPNRAFAAKLDAAQKAEDEAKAALTAAEAKRDEAQAAVDAADGAVKAAEGDAKAPAQDTLKAAKAVLAEAKKAVTAAKKGVTKAERATKTAKTAADKEAAKAAKAAEREANQMPLQNDIRRPKPDSQTGKAWAIFDELSNSNGSPASIGEALPIATGKGINEATVRTQYARWRKFHGITGRIEAPKEATPPAPPAEAPPAPPAG